MADSTTAPFGPNPSGLCMCGCGQATPLARWSKKKHNIVKGLPLRYLPGHTGHNKKPGRPCHVLDDRSYVVEPETGCWLWLWSVDKRGYAKYLGRHAHTLYWEQATGGAIEPGIALHHLCENKRCVNPAHLKPVPQRQHARAHAAVYGGGKLTWEKANYIRLLADEGARRQHLAAMFKVDKTTISEVIRRKTWA